MVLSSLKANMQRSGIGPGYDSLRPGSLRPGGSGDRIPVGGEIFHNCPDWSCGPLSLLHNGYQVSLPGVNRPGRSVHHPSASSVEVKEIVELYLYFLSGPSWWVTIIIIIIIIIMIIWKLYQENIR